MRQRWPADAGTARNAVVVHFSFLSSHLTISRIKTRLHNAACSPLPRVKMYCGTQRKAPTRGAGGIDRQVKDNVKIRPGYDHADHTDPLTRPRIHDMALSHKRLRLVAGRPRHRAELTSALSVQYAATVSTFPHITDFYCKRKTIARKVKSPAKKTSRHGWC